MIFLQLANDVFQGLSGASMATCSKMWKFLERMVDVKNVQRTALDASQPYPDCLVLESDLISPSLTYTLCT